MATSWIELVSGLGIGSIVTAVASYIHARARSVDREAPKTSSPPAPVREFGGLTWFWKELRREKGAWKVVEHDVHALEARIAMLEGKSEGEAASRRGRG